MLTRYFRLTDAVQAGTWSLGTPLDGQGQELEDLTAFTRGRPVQAPDRMRLRIRERGRRRDFNLVGASGVPLIHSRMAALFAEFTPQEVQLVPVDIKGCSDEYLILVATRLIRCIDEEASEGIHLWRPEDGRPDTAGHYRDVVGMRIDPMKVDGTQVFRTWGWSVALIVSEHIKLLLERGKLTGAAFEEV
ncbi:imm11 family protein [Myxococcus fulvus]|uniref:imm11 family protein n=1 Tax=Myxococcus fulvus TaxID=33 RepID=UPI003B9AFF30